MVAEARYVRGIQTGWWFLKWFGRSFRGWLRRGSRHSQAGRPPGPATPSREAFNVPIVALGARAQSVFPTSFDKMPHVDDERPTVVLADEPSHLRGIDAPAVTLSALPHLSVPALDPCVDNPVGWRRRVDNRVAALGPRRLLPTDITAHHVVEATDHDLLRRCHHIEDVQAFHAGPVERAGTLVRLAASGLPIHLADHDAELRALLGDAFHDLMTTDIADADADRRESISIKTRRIALRDHSLRGRLRQAYEAASVDRPAVPSVSILLPTKRPGLLHWAIGNVAKQGYPSLELVLALHGDAFDTSVVEGHIDRLALPVKLVRVGEGHPLGTVLNAATAAASGSLLTKMDDDDLYDGHHVWDLVLAHEYSGADLVGKGAETVYLGDLDRTIQRYRESEIYSGSIAGGTLLIAREAIDRIGGWQPVPRQVDRALIDRVVQDRGTVYRTHGAGFVLIRHGRQHTWHSTNEELLSNAKVVHHGWRPSLADVDNAPQPYMMGDRQ